jgi:hypothetical protein
MLSKNLDASFPRHDYEQATQLAMKSLERSLMNLGDLRVFNGLRLVQGQHVFHLDHLILHRHGFILLENAAMMLEVSVNAMGEWTHIYCDAPLRVPSPLLQVERKLKRLHKLVVVADDVKLEVPRGTKLPELVKANQLPRQLQLIAAQSKRKAKATLGYKAKGLELSDTELYKISAFLRSQHEPK